METLTLTLVCLGVIGLLIYFTLVSFFGDDE